MSVLKNDKLNLGVLDVGELKQMTIHSHPTGIIRVRGKIGYVNPKEYSFKGVRWQYAKLTGENSISVSIKCQSSQKPKKGQLVIFTCVPESDRFQLTLDGVQTEGLRGVDYGESVYGEAPVVLPETSVDLTSTRQPVLLRTFLTKYNDISRLLVITTKTGSEDVKSALDGYPDLPNILIKSCFSNASTISEAVTEEIENWRPAAIALIRGGGKDLIESNTWNDPLLVKTLIDTGIPFYTAVGHAANKSVVDVHADQFFSTPTSFGGTLKALLIEKEKINKQQNFITAQKRELKELERTLGEQGRKVPKSSRLLRLTLAVALIVIALQNLDVLQKILELFELLDR